MPRVNALYHMYSDDESEEEVEEEPNYEKIYKQICDLNYEEIAFFEDISNIGAFYRFNYAYPKTEHWNTPQYYKNESSLFYKFVDNKTLKLICPNNHNYIGEGDFFLSKDLVDTLFMFANRWCIAHDINDIFWVASCIIQFSCI